MDNKDSYHIVQAQHKQTDLEELIPKYEFFILRCASDSTGKYISKHDDEWSVALEAFVSAVNHYDPSVGEFMPFAKLIIKRRLIDYARKQKRYENEILVSTELFNDEAEEDQISLKENINYKIAYEDQWQLKEEIASANDCFSKYGFTFFDLVYCSPKAEKTKAACKKAINFLLENPPLIDHMRSSNTLSLQIIQKNTGVPRKILERHRKYIIAATEILSGEYPCLAYYMRTIRKESKQ